MSTILCFVLGVMEKENLPNVGKQYFFFIIYIHTYIHTYIYIILLLLYYIYNYGYAKIGQQKANDPSFIRIKHKQTKQTTITN